MNGTDIVNLGLYGALGVALAASGVGVMEKPWQFAVIMAIVIGIGVTSK